MEAPPISTARFQEFLAGFNLEQLFNELGWDKPTLKPETVTVNGESFTLEQLAHKRGVAVFRCSSDRSGNIPPRPTLLKIEQEASKRVREHLMIFADAAESAMTWLWVMRAPGQPTTIRTHTWRKGQSGESLRQKLGQIVWSIDEEEAITLTDVITGLKRAFDRDTISKTFYVKFKAQHEGFAKFIKGLRSSTDQEWYASLMLNRLMFVYFIQKKGFLDGDIDYLQSKLEQVQATAGKGKFHSFYRQFLRRLFHEGLGQSKAERNHELSKLIGDVPYLNGGLFSLHEIEEAHPNLDVPDEAFEQLFKFFDSWDWHLDDRPLRSGNEINPDVLGYIFEKYINQKQMGAYYTKEDITEYISKNTVIPHLLEKARDACSVAFEGEASVWSLLREDADRYIFPAMRSGVIDVRGELVPKSVFPDFVQRDIDEARTRVVDRRYNLEEAGFVAASGGGGSLPTETWREYIERRNCCSQLRAKLVKGEVQSPSGLVELNVDIRQFMQDVIDMTSSPDLLRAIWLAIVGKVPGSSTEKFQHGITVLDPTCGSGAFLFAALNVLEPLYEACLDRMEAFVEDARKLGKAPEPDFVRILDQVGKHPSRSYFVYKSIILNNLFGVDIMPEAVEICKLRLFLKLVSQVDRGNELEPLPDIDFNIRVGNSLVGYATEAQFDNGLGIELVADFNPGQRREIKASIADVAELFDRFREQQTVYGGKVTHEDKKRLREKLDGLSLELDRYLARDYDVDPDKPRAFAAWRGSHQPFHWIAQFYGVMRDGGFDAVIGNPPYVEMRDLANAYRLTTYKTQVCGNLYAMCSERALALVRRIGGKFGFIIPVASICTDRYSSLKGEFLSAGRCFFSSYNDRPGRLFDGLEHIRLTIVLVHREAIKTVATTKYNKWHTAARDILFPTLRYQEGAAAFSWTGSIPKIGTPIETTILQAVNKAATPIGALVTEHGAHAIYYTRKLSGFVQVLDFIPEIVDGGGNQRPPSELKRLSFADRHSAQLVLALLNSSLFYWFITLYSDVRNLNKREILGFLVQRVAKTVEREIVELSAELMTSFRKTSRVLRMNYQRHGVLNIQCIYPRLSKSIIDQIDLAYGRAIGLSDEQLDFIINYDIKYRMGDAEGST